MANWARICSGNLRKNMPSSNLEVILVEVSGHKNVVHEDGWFLNTERRKVKQVIDLLLLGADVCPAEALFELLVRIVECREMIHDILNTGHRLLWELAHTVMVFGERGCDVPGREGALTHVEPCVRPLQPEVRQVQAGAHCHGQILIT